MHRRDKSQQPRPDLYDRTLPVDDAEPAGLGIMFQHGAGHTVIDPQPRLHQPGGVIRPLVEFAAADVAEHLPPGRMQRPVIRRLTVAADQAAREAFDNRGVGHPQANHRIERAVQFCEQAVKELRLVGGAGKAVKQHAFAGRALRTPFLHDRVHHLVGHEFALIHIFAGQQTEGAAGLQMMAEQIAGGDMAEIKTRAEAGSVGAFARAGRSDQGNIHGWADGALRSHGVVTLRHRGMSRCGGGKYGGKQGANAGDIRRQHEDGEGVEGAGENLLRPAGGADRNQQALRAVMGGEGDGVCGIGLKAHRHGLGPVIGPLPESGAALVANSFGLRRPARYMKHRVALRTDPSAGVAGENLGVGQLVADHGVELQVLGGEEPVDRLRLRQGARKVVEHEAATAVQAVAPFADQPEHDLVRDEFTVFHYTGLGQGHRRVGLGLRAAGGAKHFARRELAGTEGAGK